MMKKSKMLLSLLCAGMMGMSATDLFAGTVTGQTAMAAPAPDDQVITGTVEDADGPMIGATVKVVGSNNGAVTDLNGQFKIKCKPGAMLEFSYVGYASQQVKAKDGMKVVMGEDKTTLSEVVVTALGIKRDRKALGYGLAEVKGEELTKAKETNVINSLSGKVAGLVVQNTAGGASGSTRVLLRGNTEMTGNNQPLYVVDGVPLDNTNFGAAGRRLRDFKKLELQPGETQTVTFSLAANDLAFVGYDGRWRLEEGDFVLSAGTQQVKVACEKTFVWDTPNR